MPGLWPILGQSRWLWTSSLALWNRRFIHKFTPATIVIGTRHNLPPQHIKDDTLSTPIMEATDVPNNFYASSYDTTSTGSPTTTGTNCDGCHPTQYRSFATPCRLYCQHPSCPCVCSCKQNMLYCIGIITRSAYPECLQCRPTRWSQWSSPLASTRRSSV